MKKEIPSTCEQILHLIIERGPITPGELAKLLVLTPAAVRRHISVLVRDGHIEVYEGHNQRRKNRGRPSRRYVATTRGQAQLEEGYADMATEALRFINKRLGEKGVNEFIEQQVASIEERYGEVLAAAGSNPVERAKVLARALDKDGFMTTLRRGGPFGMALQLCQGHCPVQDVAEEFPALCEAETQVFSRLLGVPIQRLATLAGGEHVCTTSIPIGDPQMLRARLGAKKI
ncbi:metalloregulator ArsR/SmtB family transcription factor [uncultured Arcanobacterium sp.]|uniref:helix-turn-helix transcriptional regulator n=1 Tax=uncultured Arcanobacterium sp. TaxID=487520 RepID=UPI00261801C2|nr:MarR family transcriptional regulator [uncultured Arcanobacterium sp.]